MKGLIDLLEKYRITGGITFFTIIGIYILWKTGLITKIAGKLTEMYIDNFMKKNKSSTDVTKSDIINHDIFNYIDFWRFSKVPTFEFSTEYRTIVFKKYLSIYLKSHKEKLYNYVVSEVYVEMDDPEFRRSFLNLINDIIYDYEKQMLDSGIPKIVIDKMKAKNSDVISLTIDLIEGVCTSQFYKSDSNLLKIYSILNIMLSVLDNTIQQSETVCNSINGQLKGLTISENGKTYTEP